MHNCNGSHRGLGWPTPGQPRRLNQGEVGRHVQNVNFYYVWHGDVCLVLCSGGSSEPGLLKYLFAPILVYFLFSPSCSCCFYCVQQWEISVIYICKCVCGVCGVSGKEGNETCSSQRMQSSRAKRRNFHSPVFLKHTHMHRVGKKFLFNVLK